MFPTMKVLTASKSFSVLRQAICLALVTGICVATHLSQAGGPYTITQSVIAGGGGSAAGGSYGHTGTTGQAAAGESSIGGSYNLRSGFWHGVLGSTAAAASISGQVTTPSGQGLVNAFVRVTRTDGYFRIARTSAFGYYAVQDVEVGQTYIVSVESKRFVFAPRLINLSGDLSGFDFIASP